jgi:hypothetical protein
MEVVVGWCEVGWTPLVVRGGVGRDEPWLVIFLLVELPRWVLGAEADVSVGRDEGWLVIFVLVELPR